MNRRSLVVDVHEPGDSDNAVGAVFYMYQGVSWHCYLCDDYDDGMTGLAGGLESLVVHLEMQHPPDQPRPACVPKTDPEGETLAP